MQKGCWHRTKAACRRCSLGFGRGVFCSFGVGQSGATWATCQNKLSAFLRSACNSLFFNALKSQKKCAEVYEGQSEPTQSSRFRAPRRKTIVYLSKSTAQLACKSSLPSRENKMSHSRLRPHCNPNNPQKNYESNKRDERAAERIGVCENHKFSSSSFKMPSQFSFVLK